MIKTCTTCRCVWYDKMLGYFTLKAILLWEPISLSKYPSNRVAPTILGKLRD